MCVCVCVCVCVFVLYMVTCVIKSTAGLYNHWGGGGGGGVGYVTRGGGWLYHPFEIAQNPVCVEMWDLEI